MKQSLVELHEEDDENEQGIDHEELEDVLVPEFINLLGYLGLLGIKVITINF